MTDKDLFHDAVSLLTGARGVGKTCLAATYVPPSLVEQTVLSGIVSIQ